MKVSFTSTLRVGAHIDACPALQRSNELSKGQILGIKVQHTSPILLPLIRSLIMRHVTLRRTFWVNVYSGTVIVSDFKKLKFEQTLNEL